MQHLSYACKYICAESDTENGNAFQKERTQIQNSNYIPSVTDSERKNIHLQKKTLEIMNKHKPPQNAASIHLIYETTVTLLFSLINLKAQREH